MYSKLDLTYKKIVPPQIVRPEVKPVVPKEIFEKRLENVVSKMNEAGMDALAIYADREHYGSFKYFTNCDPRFEEALLVIHKDGRAYVALGNECAAIADVSAIDVTGVSCQMFSLPNQPMDMFVSLEKSLRDCGIVEGMRIGLVDWKLLRTPDGEYLKDKTFMPHYLVEEIANIVGSRDLLSSATGMLIAPDKGMRIKAEAAAIAEYEFGATLASESVIEMLKAVEPGMSEMQMAKKAVFDGQVLNVHTYSPSGENLKRGLISPTNRVMQKGDPMIASFGLEGGLTCRSVILAEGPQDMSVDGEYYMEEIVKPYIAAVYNWYEMIGIGVCCGDMFDMISECLPADKYGWKLNPGHMTAYEEWSCSPFFKGSKTVIESGMMFQMDIIPSDPNYPTPNDEDGLVIADEDLRREIEENYPDVYDRFMARRKFVEEQIGIKLKPEVLPMSNCFAIFNPFVLNRDMSIAVKE